MEKEKKAIPVHKDIFGFTLTEGTKVVTTRSDRLRVCTVTRMTEKMVLVTPVNEARPSNGFRVYSKDTVLVDGPDVLHYILSGKRG